VIADVLNDLRYAARMLGKNPGLTLITIATLGLGIGANTAVFSVANAVLFKPLPAAQPEELVSVYTGDYSGTPYGGSSYPDYLDFRDRAELLSGMLAYWRQTVRLQRGSGDEFITADMVTSNYFEVLGVRPAAGRMFSGDEDLTPGAHPVIVISHGCWQRRFGGDPAIVGQSIQLNDTSYAVIGICQDGFAGLLRGTPTDIFVPISMSAQIASRDAPLDNRGSRVLSLLGRLKDGVTVQQARRQFERIAEQQLAAWPRDWTSLSGKGRAITVLPENQSRIPPEASELALGITGLVTVVMLLVLAVACANLTGLFLARAIARRKEMALRLALGASRWRLIRQLLSESLLVTLIGGCLGAVLAWWAVDIIRGLLPPLAIDLSPDARVVMFALAVSLVTASGFGLAPAVQATKQDLTTALKEESSQTGYRRSRLRSGLVIAQIAVSVLLLSVSGLFLRSLVNAASVDPGFNTSNLLVAGVMLKDQPAATGSAFFQQMTERLGSLPGVRDVSLSNRVGLDFDGTRRNVTIPSYTPEQGEDMEIAFNLVGPRYFQTMQTPLQRGRDFTDRDVSGAPLVVVINETMARRYFPGQDPIGKQLSVSGRQGPFLEIVGVARDGKYWSLFEEPRPFFSLPLLQHYQGFANVMLRTDGDPRNHVDMVRSEIQSLDDNLTIFNIATMREQIDFAMMPLRIASISSLIFGGLAVLLGGIGIYGLMSYVTGQRTREIGVRLALGAQRRDILKLVLGKGLGIVIIGMLLGVFATVAATRALTTFLFGVSPTDVLTLISVALAVAFVALLACFIPARRASKVDPLAALRYE
jgi:predicted permease